jgi:HlyD family secretion protein
MTDSPLPPDPLQRQQRTGGGRLRKSWHTIGLPLAILLALIGILCFAYREQLTPAVPVETDKVILLAHGDSGNEIPQQAESQLLFQASGWIEPDPWPVNVAVLTDGFVSQVWVKAGEAVTNGQVLATLDDADAQLERDLAEAAVATEEARVERAEDMWMRIQALPQRDATDSERTAARTELQEQRARLATARTSLAEAQLALARTVIRAPIDGIVLERFVHPGSKRMAAMDDPNSASIVSLFNPQELQVRVDVPLAEAARLHVGQPTRIASAILPGQTFPGHVTRIVGQADLQRNTLQAKVRIDEPDPRMRPDILCRVEFWSHEDAVSPAAQQHEVPHEGSGRHRLWMPTAALDGSPAENQQVWVVNPMDQTVEQRSVRLGQTTRGAYRLVLDGVRANETVVTSAQKTLTTGRRVTLRQGKEKP